MSKRRTWAALPAVALTSLSLLAAGCAAATSGSAGSGQATASPTGAASGSATGSSGSPGPVPTTTASGSPASGQVACANWPASVRHGPLPVSFVPVTVLRCVTTTKLIQGKGLYLVATLERSTSGIAQLVAALRHPVTHLPAGTMCPMIAMIPPQIVLVSQDGSMLTPTFPVDGCGLIRSPVLKALNAMPWQPVSVRLYPQGPAPSATATGPAASSAGQNPVDLVPGRVSGTPQVNGQR